MALQAQHRALRVRVKETKLPELLVEPPQRLALQRRGVPLFVLRIETGGGLRLTTADDRHLVQPDDALRRHVATRPNREAPVLAVENDLQVDFEVGVRDRVHARGPQPQR